VTRRAVKPTPGELANNPRAASGRLRVAAKIADSDGAALVEQEESR
jgi:16S rRNA C1402 N4-methylase RsmH